LTSKNAYLHKFQRFAYFIEKYKSQHCKTVNRFIFSIATSRCDFSKTIKNTLMV